MISRAATRDGSRGSSHHRSRVSHVDGPLGGDCTELLPDVLVRPGERLPGPAPVDPGAADGAVYAVLHAAADRRERPATAGVDRLLARALLGGDASSGRNGVLAYRRLRQPRRARTFAAADCRIAAAPARETTSRHGRRAAAFAPLRYWPPGSTSCSRCCCASCWRVGRRYCGWRRMRAVGSALLPARRGRGFLVVYAAPGNAVRRADFPLAADVALTLRLTAKGRLVERRVHGCSTCGCFRRPRSP